MLRLYPDIPARRANTVVRDVAVIGLLVLCALIGLRVHSAVDKLAVLGEGVRKAGAAVPLVGDPVEDLGKRGEDGVHRLATLLGLVTFLLPALAVLSRYLPPRLAQVRQLTAAERVLRGGDARLVAMRSAFSLPYGRLVTYTRDPLGDLADGRYDALVAAALEDAGLAPR